ncbi:MAG TPA: DNA repair protein RecN [Rhodospirillales bacterium]
MLTTLSIRDVVLIEQLDISFESGLAVLTGETGAGKSILLDALGLALGVRAEARLVRHGAEQAAVTAAFELSPDHPVHALLKEQGLGDDGGLVLRRVLGADGRSRAFVNDQPVSVQLLRELGEMLVEIHGQFESQRLLNVASHRGLLDAYGGLVARVTATGGAYAAWQDAGKTRRQAEDALAGARRDQDYLKHALDELQALAPVPGEESELAQRRSLMMHAEKLAEALNAAATDLRGDRSALSRLESARRHLERVADKAEGRLTETIAALLRAATETAEADALLEAAAADLEADPKALEAAEERLFALRALGRKHNVSVDGLAALAADIEGRLQSLDDSDRRLTQLREAETKARQAYVDAARGLSRDRAKAAARLDKAVARELKPLKLDKAKFSTEIETLAEDAWGPPGIDKVQFQVATNPGAPKGPLHKISSGGELARFMLALKAVLAEADPVPTLVFDEVDSGVGGAVAAAVGDRLATLARGCQVLVVTHSPQVAARGSHHWLVSKADAKAGVLTTVDVLTPEGRKEEIARMLAGAQVTDEARAAAGSLLESASP